MLKFPNLTFLFDFTNVIHPTLFFLVEDLRILIFLMSKKVSPFKSIKSFLILFFNKFNAPAVSSGFFSIRHLIFTKF